MRISKLYLVVCGAALCAGVIAARAGDNPAQAAARAALEAKMRQMSNPPAMNNTPAPAPAKPAKQAQPAPAAVTPSAAHPAPASGSNQGWFGNVPPPSGSRIMLPESQATAESKTTVSNPAAERKEEHPQPVKTVRARPQAPAQRPVYTERRENPNAQYPGKSFGFKPIEAPPLPITQSQQEQLRELLQKYEANDITPEQYQTERARILHER